MTTRAKFKCITVTEHEGGNKSASFTPVVGGSEENKTFWKYTPSGSLDLTWLNPNVEFRPGQEYYLDITPAIPVATS